METAGTVSSGGGGGIGIGGIAGGGSGGGGGPGRPGGASAANTTVASATNTTSASAANTTSASAGIIGESTTGDPSLERLYRSYSAKQKRAALPCFVFAAFAYDIYALTLPSFQPVVTLVFILIWCVTLGWPRLREHRATPHVAWSLFLLQLLLHLGLQPQGLTPRDSLGWVLLLDFLLYVALPLPLRFCLLVSVITCSLYLVLVVILVKSEPYLLQQVCHVPFKIMCCKVPR